MMQTDTKRNYAAGLNSALFKALGHPMRYRILMIAGERIVSPTELAEMLGESFQKVYAQVRVLAEGDEPLLELVDTDTRMGGEQHFYRAVVRPIVDSGAWDELPLLAREATTAVNTGVIIGEISASVKAGRFDAHPSRAILRRPVRVDNVGARKIIAALVAVDDACIEAEEESAVRADEGEDERLKMLAATFLFHRADD
jgi:DNA-binding transcriptional ArsR family regulator